MAVEESREMNTDYTAQWELYGRKQLWLEMGTCMRDADKKIFFAKIALFQVAFL